MTIEITQENAIKALSLTFGCQGMTANVSRLCVRRGLESKMINKSNKVEESKNVHKSTNATLAQNVCYAFVLINYILWIL